MTTWVIWQDEGRWCYSAQHAPWRWDLSAQIVLPLPALARGPALWLCRQVRQDLWRTCQHLRGFSPMVQLAHGPKGMTLRGGGALRAGGHVSNTHLEAVHTLLNSPSKQARWVTQTRRTLPPEARLDAQ